MNIIRHTGCLILLGLMVQASALFAQMSEKDVRAKLDQVYAGKAEEVRAELPSLLSRYPKDAGVRYIQAVLTTDGAVAVKRYEEIAGTFPESVWADDALYKVYQYDYSNGLYKKADSVMAHLRAAYPRSIYVTAGAPGDAPAKKEEPKKAEPPKEEPKKADVKKAEPAKEEPQKTELKKAETQERAAKTATAPAKTAASPAKTAPSSSSSSSSDAGAKKEVSGAKKDGAGAKKDVSGVKKEVAGARAGYDVQAGYFSTEANARATVKHLSDVTGRDARVRTRTSGGRTMYLVIFEGFETAESAKRFSTELRSKHNTDSFVTPR